MQRIVAGRSRVSALRIAGLAFLTSTVAAVTVLYGLRRLLGTRAETETGPYISTAAQPAVDTEMTATLPRHFTEDLVIPGFTETGPEVDEQESAWGRSP